MQAIRGRVHETTLTRKLQSNTIKPKHVQNKQVQPKAAADRVTVLSDKALLFPLNKVAAVVDESET